VNICSIITRLVEIEKALDTYDISIIRRMIWETQECALRIQKEAIQLHSSEDALAEQFTLPLNL